MHTSIENAEGTSHPAPAAAVVIARLAPCCRLAGPLAAPPSLVYAVPYSSSEQIWSWLTDVAKA